MYAVELENISKAFKNHQAVDNLSLTVPKGSIRQYMRLAGEWGMMW